MTQPPVGKRIMRAGIALMFIACMYEIVATRSFLGDTNLAYCDDRTVNSRLDLGKGDSGAGNCELLSMGKEVLAKSSDPDVRIEADDMIVNSVQMELGCDAAVKECERLKASLNRDNPSYVAEIKTLDNLLNLNKELSKIYQGLLTEYKAPDGTWRSHRTQLEAARATLLYGGKQKFFDAYERIIADSGKSDYAMDVTYEYIDLLHDCGEGKKSAALAESTLKMYPQCEYAIALINTIGEICNGDKSYDRCVSVMTELSKLSPRTEAAYCALNWAAYARLMNGDKDGALLQYAEVANLDVDGKNGKEAFNRIMSIGSPNQGDALIIKSLLKVASAHPATRVGAVSYLCVGRIYKTQGKTAQAQNVFQSIVTGYPSTDSADKARSELITIYQENGQELLDQKNPSGALSIWRKAYAIDVIETRRAEALCSNASTLIFNGQYSEARSLLSILKQNPAESITKWREIAECLDAKISFKTGDYNNALPVLRRIVSTARYRDTKEMANDLIAQISAKSSTN